MSYDDELNELLTMGVEDAPPPKQLPAGLWEFEVDDVSVIPATETKSGGLLFRLAPKEPGDGVDPEAAEDFLDTDEKPVSWHRQYLQTKDDVYRLGQMLAAIGTDTSGKSVKDAAMETVGSRLSAVVTYAPNKDDPQRPWQRLKGWGLPFSDDPDQ